MDENIKKDEILEKEKNNDTNNKEEKIDDNNKAPKKKSKIRMTMVLIFIALFTIVTYIVLKGSYLEYKELGENYISVF